MCDRRNYWCWRRLKGRITSFDTPSNSLSNMLATDLALRLEDLALEVRARLQAERGSAAATLATKLWEEADAQRCPPRFTQWVALPGVSKGWFLEVLKGV